MGLDQYTKYAPFIVRLGLGLVLIWFGVDALIHPGIWASLVPYWILSLSHVSANTFMYLNGIFEIILGILLLIGFWTRLAAALTACVLIGIIFSLGYGDLAVRDFGLLMAALSLILSGGSSLSLKTSK